MIDKFKVEPDYPVRTDTLASDDGNDRGVEAFAFYSEERPGFYVERGENRRAADADVLGYADLAGRDVAALIEHLDQERFGNCEPRMPTQMAWQPRFVGVLLGIDEFPKAAVLSTPKLE